MNSRQAKLLNRKDGSGSGYFPGLLTERYFTKDALIADAIRFVETRYSIDLLIEGSECQPGLVHYCRNSSSVTERLSEVGAEIEAMYDESDDPWKLDKEKAERLEKEWKELLASLNKNGE
jgi:hypothetical protein